MQKLGKSGRRNRQVIFTESQLNKMIEESRTKAYDAYLNYQNSGASRYLRTQEKHEAMADTLQSVLDSYGIREREKHLSAQIGLAHTYLRGEYIDDPELSQNIRYVLRIVEELNDYIKLSRGY